MQADFSRTDDGMEIRTFDAQRSEPRRDGSERSAVVHGRAEAGKRREMLGHTVAHVPLEAVAGMLHAEPLH